MRGSLDVLALWWLFMLESFFRLPDTRWVIFMMTFITDSFPSLFKCIPDTSFELKYLFMACLLCICASMSDSLYVIIYCFCILINLSLFWAVSFARWNWTYCHIDSLKFKISNNWQEFRKWLTKINLNIFSLFITRINYCCVFKRSKECVHTW